ncbi:hypothetical protein [Aurantiacibacter sp. MUD61]|uniref:hypothetical protein n=1 Tax=Aurantiacibacter sp. MUD61 TaxID=3009083 RepID=UPI0022F0E3B2|nr:hypothetical protein [Aurantiacibacter sp. MUD61]
MKPLPLSAIFSQFYREAKKTKLCFHPEAEEKCSSVFSAAHTIQKRTGLAVLAEQNHILSGRNDDPRDISGGLTSIGINLASTFYGFCSHHDSETFKPAETAKEPNRNVAFLLSYRALSFEIYMKMVAIKTLEFARDHIDRGLEFEQQCESQQEIAAGIFGLSLGYDEHRRFKRDWDTSLLNGDFSSLEWSFIQFDGLLPISTSGVFLPEYDFQGRNLQSLDAPAGSLAMMGFNILPINGKTCAIFGWIDAKEPNRDFISSLHQVPDHQLASVLIQFGFDTSENLFVKPSWWEGLDARRRTYLERNLRSSIPGSKWSRGLMPQQPTLLELPIISRRTWSSETQ